MARQYIRRKPYKYSIKQMNYWKRKSKNEKMIKKWERQILILKRKIANVMTKRPETDKKRKMIEKWAKQQELELIKDYQNQYKVEQKSIMKRAIRPKQKMPIREGSIINYLKREHIAEIRRNLGNFDIKGAYNALLNKALLKPNEFKELIIGQMDKLKHLLRVEMDFYVLIGKQPIKSTTLTIRGKTLEELKNAMIETGIITGQLFDSIKYNQFKAKLNQEVPISNRIEAGTLINIDMRISLRRGKV